MDSRYLTAEAVEALRRFRFAPFAIAEGNASGNHRSYQRGQASEFSRYRPYSPGEDLRHLDWKVLGRCEKQVLRTYEDETNLLTTIVLDVSGSMQFGPPGSVKLDYGRTVAAALIFCILQGRDQAGLATVSDRLLAHLPPGGTPSHLKAALALLEREPEPRSATRLGAALTELVPAMTRRGALVVLSDFLLDDAGELERALRLFRSLRFRIMLFHLVHPLEETLPRDRALRFEDLEGPGSLLCSPADLAEHYERAFVEHLSRVHAIAAGLGCDHRVVSMRRPVQDALRELLVPRDAGRSAEVRA